MWCSTIISRGLCPSSLRVKPGSAEKALASAPRRGIMIGTSTFGGTGRADGGEQRARAFAQASVCSGLERGLVDELGTDAERRGAGRDVFGHGGEADPARGQEFDLGQRAAQSFE